MSHGTPAHPRLRAQAPRRRWLRAALHAGLLPLFSASPARAQPGAAWTHALSWGEVPALPADFQQLPYVAAAPRRGGTLQLDGFGSFDKLNPYTLRGIAAAGLGTLVFETLGEASWDEALTAYPLLARAFAHAPDGLSVRFALDERARFSDGSPVLAEDVKHSFESLTGRFAHPRFAQIFADVARCVVEDERTLRFEFRQHNQELHMVLATALPVFSRRWGQGRPFDQIGREEPVASGPYRLDGGVQAVAWGRRIAYARAPQYWGESLPVRRGMFNFDRVVYKYFRDETARLEAFKAGEFDWINENSARNWVRGHTGRRYADGELIKRRFRHSNAVGMQGFAMNLRRPLFRDRRVRQALALAFDFEWMNRQVFLEQYTRTRSYFENTPMRATGVPGADELHLLEPLRERLDPAVFGEVPVPPDTLPPGSLRENLRRAQSLLTEAGWTVAEDGALRNAAGQAFEFEVLSYSPTLERVASPWARNLLKLGIAARLRTTDPALYQQRLDSFDYDVTTAVLAQSRTPGNEQWQYFGSQAAVQPGSDNLPGIQDPAIDALIEHVVRARTREALDTAVQALDRVLRHGWYMVPHYHAPDFRIAHARRLKHPEQLPLYFAADAWLLKTWWLAE